MSDACELLPKAQLEKLVGGKVMTAQSTNLGSSTSCNYMTADSKTSQVVTMTRNGKDMSSMHQMASMMVADIVESDAEVEGADEAKHLVGVDLDRTASVTVASARNTGLMAEVLNSSLPEDARLDLADEITAAMIANLT